MSILEKFYILFEADASNVKKGSDEAKKSVDTLQTSLNSTNASSQKLGSSFVQLMKQASGAFLAFASVGGVVAGVKSFANAADNIGKLSRSLNVNVEDLEAWGSQVKMAGGSVESFQQTAKTVTASLADFATKGTSRAAPFFKELGVRMTDAKGNARSFIDVLPEIASAFEKLGKSQSFGIGQKMGLDEGTIMLLQKGRKEVEESIKQQRELGIFNKRNTQISEDFNDQVFKTKLIFQGLFAKISELVLPVLTALGRGFESAFRFFKQNPELVEGALIAIAGILTARLLPALIRTAAASIAAFAPFYAMAAVLGIVAAAFALIYDDIQHYLAGNNSVIGELSKKWPIVGDIVRTLVAEFKLFWDVVKAFGNLLLDLFTDPLNAWDNFKKAIGKGVEEFLNKFPWVKESIKSIGAAFGEVGEFIKGIWDSIISVIKGAIDIILGAVDKVVGVYKKVKGFFGGGDDKTSKSVESGKNAIALASSSPIASQSVNSIVSSSRALSKHTAVNVGEVNINTQATDAQGIATAFGQSFDQQLKQAINNFDDGVLA